MTTMIMFHEVENADMKAFEEFLASEELQKQTAADGIKLETLRTLTES